ncbi:MAG TPA: NAD-dependent epimerase/dehydratase family protein [Gemmatimonadaceae bacterium]|jgi:CDP-paratose 2-epimerase|nr:NAD-dependent epimerase/dehydratase family protein [Gemmatimonadaceae bacterium]
MAGERSVLVTGSSGLIGSEVVARFHDDGFRVDGVDNNSRAAFFGPLGDTRRNQARLEATYSRFHHHELDVRDRDGVRALVAELRPAVVVHCAGQPSHDRAAAIPFDDFDVNATGTLNLLEAARQSCGESPFILISTNKVYGDGPNAIPVVELPTRWDYADARHQRGVDERFPIDQSMHSLFGASKLSADVMTQEYGRYFGMPTCSLRCGCVTGRHQAGVELHGFLSYLVRCGAERRPYHVYGYAGKQVRDNLHAADVAAFCAAFAAAPRADGADGAGGAGGAGGEVYNLGGGRANSVSILEALDRVAQAGGAVPAWDLVDGPRPGDHICYISDISKARDHYPGWDVTRGLDAIVEDLVLGWRAGR